MRRLTLFAALVALSGCAGGVSKGDFTARADRVCADAGGAGRVGRGGGGFRGPLSLLRLARRAEVVGNAERLTLDELAGLDAPKDGRAVVGRLDAALAHLRVFVRRARAGDAARAQAELAAYDDGVLAWQQAAGGYGLAACSQFGALF